MKERSLKQRLVDYMKKRHTTWVASGDLQRLVAQHTTYTPRTTVRRLEELAEDGELEVEYRKGHSWYRVKQGVTANDLIASNPARLAWFDSLPV
jgi:hypothetical protein